MKIITFVSTFEHYNHEENGIKPYTIRLWTQRLQNKMEKCPTHLKIQRGYTKRSFIRKITHTLYWDKYVILAWNPNELNTPSQTNKNKEANKG